MPQGVPTGGRKDAPRVLREDQSKSNVFDDGVNDADDIDVGDADDDADDDAEEAGRRRTKRSRTHCTKHLTTPI